MVKVVDGAVVAKQSFFVGNKLVPAGQVWDAGDPLARTYKANFKPLEVQQSEPPKSPRPPKATERPRAGGRFTRKA